MAQDAPGKLPPLAERNGSRERAVAPDRDKWVAVRSASGHDYWFPPEAAHFAYGTDMSWTQLEFRLKQVLAARATAAAPAGRKPGPKKGSSVAEGTAMAAAALGLFMRHCGKEFETTLAVYAKDFNVHAFTTRATEFANNFGLHCAAHGLDPTGSVMRTLATRMLEAEQEFRATQQRPARKPRR